MISFIIFISYIIYLYNKIGIPNSISDSFYQLDKKWLFTINMFLIVFTLAPIWFTISIAQLQPLVFLSCAGLLGVGAAPYFKLGLDKKVHKISAIICAMFSVLWTCLINFWSIPLIYIIIALLINVKSKKLIFWLEIAAFLQLYTTILILILI